MGSWFCVGGGVLNQRTIFPLTHHKQFRKFITNNPFFGQRILEEEKQNKTHNIEMHRLMIGLHTNKPKLSIKCSFEQRAGDISSVTEKHLA